MSVFTILGMPPSTRKCPLRRDKKHPSESTAPYNKKDSHDSTPMSMDVFYDLPTIDDRFAEHTKNLHHEVDSKVHEWVDSTF